MVSFNSNNSDPENNDDAENEEAEEKSQSSKKKKSKIKLFVIFFIVFSVVGGAGFGAYKYLTLGKSYPGYKMSQITLSEEILVFTWDNMPDVYMGLYGINNEINMIEKEVVRIDSIEVVYPSQKKITFSEKKVWNSAKKALQKTLKSTEKSIEAIYVTYRVNLEKGKTLIDEKGPELQKASVDAIESSGKLTKRIKEREAGKGIIQKVTNIFK